MLQAFFVNGTFVKVCLCFHENQVILVCFQDFVMADIIAEKFQFYESVLIMPFLLVQRNMLKQHRAFCGIVGKAVTMRMYIYMFRNLCRSISSYREQGAFWLFRLCLRELLPSFSLQVCMNWVWNLQSNPQILSWSGLHSLWDSVCLLTPPPNIQVAK